MDSFKIREVSSFSIGIFFIVWTSLCGCTVADPVHIVVDCGDHSSAEKAGQAEADVDWLDGDITDDTICTQCFAACELQRILRKMTGRPDDFTIVDDNRCPAKGELILIGGPESNVVSRRMAAGLGIDARQLGGLGRDGYFIKTTDLENRRVTIVAGGSRSGTLYGVYDMLHRLGCRWFALGGKNEQIPDAKWNPRFNVSEKPSFDTRGFYIFEKRGNKNIWLWMARNRLNEWSVKVDNPPLLHKLGILLTCGSHDAQQLFLGPESRYPYNHAKFDKDQDKPADPYPISDEYQGDANADGKLSYFEAHPEWYALVNGKRIPGIGGRDGMFGTNFCTSNQHACDEFMKNYVDAMVDGIYRGAKIVNFWTLDVGKWCSCQKCKALGEPTDRNLLLVHRLDREIKKEQADGRLPYSIQIRFLAYADVIDPPTRPLPADFDYKTCIATFYPIRRSYVFNFDSSISPSNSVYRRQLEGWMTDPDRHYRGQLEIGEYYNVSRFKCLPIVFMHTMENDIPYYYSVGARHFQYMHVTTGNWGNKALTNYQMARQLWEVKADCEVLWEDYFSRRYGPLATQMRVFYETLEKMLANIHELKYSLARRLDRGDKELFPEPELRYRRQQGVECNGPTLLEMVEYAKICRHLINQAMLAGNVDANIASRIAEDERMFTYGERTIGYYAACAAAFENARAGKYKESQDSYKQACRLADLLRADTTSASMSSAHASAANALEASGAIKTLKYIEKLLQKRK
ncbi:MAG: DUF4838 domain-containing protein [Pirellulales bacterium]|nr:DUF4838 domain-containing protein [Pirellulales bacterium]